jgi:hypothetical protein
MKKVKAICAGLPLNCLNNIEMFEDYENEFPNGFEQTRRDVLENALSEFCAETGAEFDTRNPYEFCERDGTVWGFDCFEAQGPTGNGYAIFTC